jgi:hypothetical protein
LIKMTKKSNRFHGSSKYLIDWRDGKRR